MGMFDSIIIDPVINELITDDAGELLFEDCELQTKDMDNKCINYELGSDRYLRHMGDSSELEPEYHYAKAVLNQKFTYAVDCSHKNVILGFEKNRLTAILIYCELGGLSSDQDWLKIDRLITFDAAGSPINRKVVHGSDTDSEAIAIRNYLMDTVLSYLPSFIVQSTNKLALEELKQKWDSWSDDDLVQLADDHLIPLLKRINSDPNISTVFWTGRQSKKTISLCLSVRGRRVADFQRMLNYIQSIPDDLNEVPAGYHWKCHVGMGGVPKWNLDRQHHASSSTPIILISSIGGETDADKLEIIQAWETLFEQFIFGEK